MTDKQWERALAKLTEAVTPEWAPSWEIRSRLKTRMTISNVFLGLWDLKDRGVTEKRRGQHGFEWRLAEPAPK